MGNCCGGESEEDNNRPQQSTEKTRLLQDVLDPADVSINNGPRRQLVSAEERAARASVAEDIERKLRDVVDQTDSKMVAIGDDAFEAISSGEVTDRQSAYSGVIRQVQGNAKVSLPVPSKKGGSVKDVLSKPIADASTYSFIDDACAEMLSAVSEIKVDPVEQSVVIDLNTLK